MQHRLSYPSLLRPPRIAYGGTNAVQSAPGWSGSWVQPATPVLGPPPVDHGHRAWPLVASSCGAARTQVALLFVCCRRPDSLRQLRGRTVIGWLLDARRLAYVVSGERFRRFTNLQASERCFTRIEGSVNGTCSGSMVSLSDGEWYGSWRSRASRMILRTSPESRPPRKNEFSAFCWSRGCPGLVAVSGWWSLSSAPEASPKTRPRVAQPATP